MPQEIYKNIYLIRVPIPNNPLRETNCYLIRGGDRDLLIDTGLALPVCRETLGRELDALGARTDTLDILLTHMHGDHAALAPEFVGREGFIYVSNEELPWLRAYEEGGYGRKMDEAFMRAGFDRKLIRSFRMQSYSRPSLVDPAKVNYVGLWDGDRLEAGGYTLSCIRAPGHTPGHMCFWIESEQIMFTGDHVLFDITPNILTWPDVPDSLGNFLCSLVMLRHYPVRLAIPGHRAGGAFVERIDELLRHHAARLDECCRLAAERAGQTPYELAGRMTWSIRANSWAEFPIRQKRYATGECMSHLEHLCVLGRMERRFDGEVDRYYV